MTVNLDFKITVYVMFRPIDALNVLCAQLTRDLFAIAKFLLQFDMLIDNLYIALFFSHSLPSLCF